MSDKEPTRFSFDQEVSAGNLTLQYFDFLAQTLDQMINRDDVDRVLLCNLLIALAQNEQFKPTPLKDLAPGRLG